MLGAGDWGLAEEGNAIGVGGKEMCDREWPKKNELYCRQEDDAEGWMWGLFKRLDTRTDAGKE